MPILRFGYPANPRRPAPSISASTPARLLPIGLLRPSRPLHRHLRHAAPALERRAARPSSDLPRHQAYRFAARRSGHFGPDDDLGALGRYRAPPASASCRKRGADPEVSARRGVARPADGAAVAPGAGGRHRDPRPLRARPGRRHDLRRRRDRGSGAPCPSRRHAGDSRLRFVVFRPGTGGALGPPSGRGNRAESTPPRTSAPASSRAASSPVFCQEEGIEPHALLHLGDNRLADDYSARAAGAAALPGAAKPPIDTRLSVPSTDPAFQLRRHRVGARPGLLRPHRVAQGGTGSDGRTRLRRARRGSAPGGRQDSPARRPGPVPSSAPLRLPRLAARPRWPARGARCLRRRRRLGGPRRGGLGRRCLRVGRTRSGQLHRRLVSRRPRRSHGGHRVLRRR